jgi:hypothetical protein
MMHQAQANLHSHYLIVPVKLVWEHTKMPYHKTGLSPQQLNIGEDKIQFKSPL